MILRRVSAFRSSGFAFYDRSDRSAFFCSIFRVSFSIFIVFLDILIALSFLIMNRMSCLNGWLAPTFSKQ
ncbi:hypothetical protein A8B83_02410 [Rhodobacteraceae bacterium EhC02]|nr:hypothetical protein A8B83_02410 [Rhodobacteraceae bacterium EhC02]